MTTFEKDLEKILKDRYAMVDKLTIESDAKNDAKEISQLALTEALKGVPEERTGWGYILLPWNWSKEKEKGFGEGYNSAIQETKANITRIFAHSATAQGKGGKE